MTDQASEKLFFHYTLKNPSMFEYISDEFFENEHIRICYKLTINFFEKYHSIPTKEQLKELIKTKKIKEFLIETDDGYKFSNNIFNLIMDFSVADYDESWLNENYDAWVRFKNLDRSVFELVEFLKVTKITPSNINDVVSKATDIIHKRNNIVFDDDDGSNFFNPDAHKSSKSNSITTGYKWLDKALGGGWMPKTLVSFCGAPKAGKCIDSNSYIYIRNKKTGEKIKIKIIDFYEFIKQKKS